MTSTKAQRLASKTYDDKRVDRTLVRFPKVAKGGKPTKEQVESHIAKTGESMNGFILRAINETMGNDNNPTAD